ncbi:MAG: asparaginase domain-containing protein [Ruminiclostridium sp.]
MSENKKLLFITTGGTIACGKGEGRTPEKSGEELLSGLNLTCKAEILNLLSIDSTDLSPDNLRQIYEAVSEKLPLYDGIVLLHGTDTLAYTAAMLFLTIRAEKPVVVTGSMLPLSEENSDGYDNIRLAASTACTKKGGVYTAFGGRIISGGDTVKVNSSEKDAFRSYSGRISPPENPYPFPEKTKPFPRVIKLTPFSRTEDFTAGKDCCGVVIETYGAGGLPHRTDILEAVKALCGRTEVVITTPCLGGARLGQYEVGRLALDCGAKEGAGSTEFETVKMWICGG